MPHFQSTPPNIKVEVAASAFKNTKIPDHLKVPQDFKLVIRNTYPASPPRLFFMSDVHTLLNIEHVQIWVEALPRLHV